MTDITELAQSLKAAAGKATPGPWVAFTHTDSRTFSVHTPDDKRCGDVIKWAGFDGQRKAKANAEFITLANPANVLALVEALEKAQAKNALVAGGIEASTKLHERIDELEEAEQKLCAANVTLDARAELAERRLAELESRTVTVKLPSLNPEMFNEDVMFGYRKAQKEAVDFCAAAGIKLEAE